MIPQKGTYPIIDIGFIIERYYKTFFIRFDGGDYIVPFGDTKTQYTRYNPEDSFYIEYSPRLGTTHNLGVGFGLGFRF